ncbi:hypothetical protein BAUCODRAFT_243984 [Baudoinia panamericana UAMH 10762]|uniref:Uncharacterized protein n=1 Tax=Baudoinia panamericana (strain UAMH 10762) TaxID=717646 RepID=M2LH99_BAUPA|nr:uncharacterized protein BAUCODRAFT_243984 [Baudoinia panamericana UAMH 10762]EMC93497.1 hypothetical protein BAUCODRAFT_243984 [Baudoinia panamericana UAMH 10762]
MTDGMMTFASPDMFNPATTIGRNAHLFQPPTSPISSIATPSYATAPDYFSSRSRKRQRPDTTHIADSRPTWQQTLSWVKCRTLSDGSYANAAASTYGQNQASINERYALAGGFDTPSLQAAAEIEGLQLSTGEGRRWRDRADSGGCGRAASAQLSGPLARERNGVGRLMLSLPNGIATTSWTGLAFNLVGKVFHFGSDVIRGFYAGGGNGFDLKQRALRRGLTNRPGCWTPLPGSWEEDEFLGDFEQDNPHSPPPTASRPPNKRRQTDKDSWVVVGTPDVEGSPRRKVSSNSIPRSELSARPAASRASSRRSLAPLPRRQSSQAAYSTGSPMASSAATSPERRASLVPARSNSRPTSGHSNADENISMAYVSPDVERFVKRRAKQDRQADAAMTIMSKKLTDLIRQGQAALGTKISVEDGGGESTDEGFVDEDW